MNTWTPAEIVKELNRYIVGQDEAKRAVAVALRNRYRRMQLPEEIRCLYLLPLGYPARAPGTKKLRSLEEISFCETYQSK